MHSTFSLNYFVIDNNPLFRFCPIDSHVDFYYYYPGYANVFAVFDSYIACVLTVLPIELKTVFPEFLLFTGCIQCYGMLHANKL